MNWYLDVLKQYAVFSGRAQRSEYWYFILFNMIVTTNASDDVILSNAKDALVSNATVYPQIMLHVVSKVGYLTISISNNGGEIPKELIDSIFDPYVTTKEKSEGSGLGLHIAKLIIEQKLHASITVDTQSNWTTFKISLDNTTI